MSLLSTDIGKVKKLSLKGVSLTAVESKTGATKHIPKEKPYTSEEIKLSKLVVKYPLLLETIELLQLVSASTLRELRTATLQAQEPVIKKTEPKDRTKLILLANRVLEVGNSYSQQDIVDRIKEATNVTQQRAEIGFNLMLEAEAIALTTEGSYTLSSYISF